MPVRRVWRSTLGSLTRARGLQDLLRLEQSLPRGLKEGLVGCIQKGLLVKYRARGAERLFRGNGTIAAAAAVLVKKGRVVRYANLA